MCFSTFWSGKSVTIERRENQQQEVYPLFDWLDHQETNIIDEYGNKNSIFITSLNFKFIVTATKIHILNQEIQSYPERI